MNDLAESGMLKAGVHVSDVARYHNCHPSTIQRLKDRYQDTAQAVTDRRRSGQPRMATGVKTTTYVDCIDDTYIYDIRSDPLMSVPDEKKYSKGNLFLMFNKNILSQ